MLAANRPDSIFPFRMNRTDVHLARAGKDAIHTGSAGGERLRCRVWTIAHALGQRQAPAQTAELGLTFPGRS
jgi:hypothetical protein